MSMRFVLTLIIDLNNLFKKRSNKSQISVAVLMFVSLKLTEVFVNSVKHFAISQHNPSCARTRASQLICMSFVTLGRHGRGIQLSAWHLVGWCTVPWSISLLTMAMLGQFFCVPRNFEIFHDRLGTRLRNDMPALTLYKFLAIGLKFTEMMHSTMEHIAIKNGRAGPICSRSMGLFMIVFLPGLRDDVTALTFKDFSKRPEIWLDDSQYHGADHYSNGHARPIFANSTEPWNFHDRLEYIDFATLGEMSHWGITCEEYTWNQSHYRIYLNLIRLFLILNLLWLLISGCKLN